MRGRNSDLEVRGGTALRGTVRLPGDKSISHRALLIAALAKQRSRIRNLSAGEDVAATRRLIEALGSEVDSDAGETVVIPGLPHGGEALSIDCGNSGTTMRLGAGILARTGRTTMLCGDPSLSARPMARVLEPLCSMGAKAWSVDGHPPIVIQPARLHGIDFTPPVASAQVKGAVLFAALGAEGETTVRETVPTRAHTEEMFRAAGVDISVDGGSVRLRPGTPGPVDLVVPGDPSAAAFWVVAASLVPGSRVVIEGLYRGQGRGGFLDVLARMGADFEVTERGPNLIDVEARATDLKATEVSEAAEIASAVDELPAIAVAAACALGTTVIAGARELRLKESDRISALCDGLRALGVGVEERPDGLVIEGVGPEELVGANVDSRGDHRIAMAMAVAGLAAQGTTTIQGWDSVAISDPLFEEQLRRLRAA